jgi:hypothetical protein
MTKAVTSQSQIIGTHTGTTFAKVEGLFPMEW